MRLIFRKILCPLVLGWAPNCIVVGAQLAPEEKMLGCIAAGDSRLRQFFSGDATQNPVLDTKSND